MCETQCGKTERNGDDSQNGSEIQKSLRGVCVRERECVSVCVCDVSKVRTGFTQLLSQCPKGGVVRRGVGSYRAECVCVFVRVTQS